MAGMYGWRARIGCIRPSGGVNAAEEYRKVAPEGVQFIDTQLLREESDYGAIEESFLAMLEKIEHASKEVASAKVQAIIQNGGALSMFRGWGSDRDIIDRIEKTTGVPATTHGIAEVEAIKRLKINKVVVFTPNDQKVNNLKKKYLEGAGLEVVLIIRLGSPLELLPASPYGLYRPVKDMFLKAPTADGIFIAGGTLRTLEIIEALEYDIGKPVVTSNQAALWKVLNMVSVREPIKGYGQLLKMF